MAILDIGGKNAHAEQKAERVDEDVTLAARNLGLSEILCLRRVDHHEFTKRSLNMMAN